MPSCNFLETIVEAVGAPALHPIKTWAARIMKLPLVGWRNSLLPDTYERLMGLLKSSAMALERSGGDLIAYDKIAGRDRN